MTEIGVCEFTAECQPGRQYLLRVEGLPPGVVGGDIGLRYTTSDTPDAEPPPVSLSSSLFIRWVWPEIPPDGSILDRLFTSARYRHFRFLLTTTEEPAPESAQVTIQDLGPNPWTST